jgi:hypothetical protein
MLARRAERWLDDVAERRGDKLWRGRASVGNAERFLVTLLADATPAAAELGTRLVGLELARAVLAARARVVAGWLEHEPEDGSGGGGALAQVEHDHLELQRAQFERDFARCR